MRTHGGRYVTPLLSDDRLTTHSRHDAITYLRLFVKLFASVSISVKYARIGNLRKFQYVTILFVSCY